jgi:drug/metabolite transporter (DMT)-like permease
MPLIFLLRRRGQNARFFQGPPREFAKAAAGGVLSIVGYGIVIWAMEHAPLGPVSALRETSVLFAVLLGCLYLREPFTWRKTLSSLLIVAGAICLNLKR